MALRRRRGIVLGVFSAKGGVGKTTTVANLGAALAQRKKGKVIIVETNMTASNLGLHLGVVDPPVTVQDLVMGRLKVEEGISKTEYGLHLLPGSIAFTTEVGSVDLSPMLESLRKKYDIIILDSAPGFAPEVTSAMRACDEVLVCCQPQIPAIAGTLQSMRALERMKIPLLGVVLTRVTGKRYEVSTSEIRRTLGWPTLVEIPEDDMVPESITRGVPVVLYAPNSPAAQEYLRLARMILARLRARAGRRARRKRVRVVRRVRTKGRGRGVRVPGPAFRPVFE
ncbi:MAG: AAA family ATPase [Candidatus Hadarchaeales archaeon]